MAGILAIVSHANSDQSIPNAISEARKSLQAKSTAHFVAALSPSDRCAMLCDLPSHFSAAMPSCEEADHSLLLHGDVQDQSGSSFDASRFAKWMRSGNKGSLGDLSGPFAFLDWNKQTNVLTAATDRLGRIPLFVYRDKKFLAVTSDLHLLFSLGIILPEPEEESIVDSLTIGFPLGEKSFFRNITRMKGGEICRLSENSIESNTYWHSEQQTGNTSMPDLVENFREAVRTSLLKTDRPVISLSGGWDSRATVAVASSLNIPFDTVTFGVDGSTDLNVASEIATALKTRHVKLVPDHNFFSNFRSLAERTLAQGNFHCGIDLAFQLHMFEEMKKEFPFVIDSAGCEFRRGFRSRFAARQSTDVGHAVDHLMSLYATALWTREYIAQEFYDGSSSSTASRLSSWLNKGADQSFDAQIDRFSSQELWGHSYAHGFPLQTSVIGCEMPFSNNSFYDRFLSASQEIRWTHRFHQAVIRAFAPALERIPISHGHIPVPYGDSALRFLPLAYHRAIAACSKHDRLRWLKRFDNSHPFRPYQLWYANELNGYARSIFEEARDELNRFVNTDAFVARLNRQQHIPTDLSPGISIALTLAHLLLYVKNVRSTTRFGR